jgi:hypothetical protein
MEFIKVFLIFATPGIVAVIARGRAWRKFAWYAGTVALAIFSLIAVDVIYSARQQLASILVLLAANIVMISAAASTGRKSK